VAYDVPSLLALSLCNLVFWRIVGLTNKNKKATSAPSPFSPSPLFLLSFFFFFFFGVVLADS